MFTGGGIEIAGGFVGEKDSRAIDESTGEGSALLFTTGEFAGAMLGASREADPRERFGDALSSLGAIDFGEAEREFYIFLESHARKEIERLEDHADGVAAVACEGGGVEFGEILAGDMDGAGGGAVESGEEIEESRLAGTGGTEQGQEFAGGDFEGEVIDGVDSGLSEMVLARDRVGADDWLAGFDWH